MPASQNITLIIPPAQHRRIFKKLKSWGIPVLDLRDSFSPRPVECRGKSGVSWRTSKGTAKDIRSRSPMRLGDLKWFDDPRGRPSDEFRDKHGWSPYTSYPVRKKKASARKPRAAAKRKTIKPKEKPDLYTIHGPRKATWAGNARGDLAKFMVGKDKRKYRVTILKSGWRTMTEARKWSRMLFAQGYNLTRSAWLNLPKRKR